MAKKRKSRKEIAGPPVRFEMRVVGRKHEDKAEPEAEPKTKDGA